MMNGSIGAAWLNGRAESRSITTTLFVLVSCIGYDVLIRASTRSKRAYGSGRKEDRRQLLREYLYLYLETHMISLV
jgi:hypothetical protein